MQALIRDQVERGWQVGVAMPEAPLAPGGESTRVRHYTWSATREPGLGLIRETLALRTIIRAFDPDVVHLHSSKAGLCGRLAVRGRRPTLYQPHGWSFYAAAGIVGRISLVWERFATRWATRIVCVSSDERDAGQTRGLRAGWEIVSNGVDATHWRVATPQERNDARAALGVDRETLLVVTVARLHRAKGVDVLAQAWKLMPPLAAPVRLIVVGDGPDRESILSTCMRNVDLVGEADPKMFLSAADLCVAPSRWEGESIAVLEAMAHGLPIVATRVSGMADLLGPECLVDVDDPDSLACKIASLLTDDDRRAKLGNRNRRFVERERSIAKSHARMADVVLSVACVHNPCGRDLQSKAARNSFRSTTHTKHRAQFGYPPNHDSHDIEAPPPSTRTPIP